MEIRTKIEIDAPAERVFRILTDFASYPAWNPLVPEASGELRVGERIHIRVVAAGRCAFTRWSWRLILPARFGGAG